MDLKKILKLFEAPVGPGAVASTAKASGIANPNLIKPGQQVKIPMQGGGFVSSTVKPGDTLSGMINRAQTNQGARAAVAPKTPAANPNQAAVDAANSTHAAQTAAVASANAPGPAPSAQASADSDAAKRNVIGGAQPTAAAAPEPAQAAVDPSVAAGQNIGGKFAGAASQQAAQADFQKLAGITPTTSSSPAAPTSPAASAQPGLKSAEVTPDMATASKPTSVNTTATVGGPETTRPNTPYSQYNANQSTKSYASLGDFASAVGNKLSGGTSSAPDTSTASGAADTANQSSSYGGPKTSSSMAEEETMEEELEEMLRLSGMPVNEKAVSKQQQKFMGMVHAMQKGEKVKGASPELKKVARTMGKKDAKDFASTKHKGLPQRVSESIMLEAGSNLEHIVTRFKHETKNFLNGADLDEDLYNALYDYYIDNGEMPYGVAKAREGDPYQWVSDHFADELSSMGHSRQFQETVMPVMDDTLSELARLAGLSESRVDECGDMGMEEQGGLNISTNMSSDGKKNVTISAQGEEAEALMQMLKLAGMGHMGHDSHTEEPVVMVSKEDDEMMEYANDPEEEYHSIDSIVHQGNDLNREKRQYAGKPKLGDNPMAEQIVDEELQSLLDSVLVREEDPKRPKGDTGRAEIFTADLGIQPPSPDEGPVGQGKPTAPAAPKAPASSSVPRPGMKK